MTDQFSVFMMRCKYNVENGSLDSLTFIFVAPFTDFSKEPDISIRSGLDEFKLWTLGR